ncbi:uncharacterized protein KIAA1614 homolog isoform X1 [Anolis sagrei]|uniref:uncharacterized protein KIAA1614 homolog isoform X1 n=1 Tax=Anolis sagrei TaxID=38937 RepID=UPI0035205FA6
MDGNFPTEKRKVLKSMKQCIKNISRSKHPLESPEEIDNYCLNGPAWVPVGLSGNPCKGTSVLESKVKALKEKRGVTKQAEAPSQERTSIKKSKAWKGKPPKDPASQDAVVEPQAQIRTYLTDVLLDSADYPHSRQKESLEAIPASSHGSDFEKHTGSKAEEEPTNVAWMSPEEFRRLRGRNIQDKKGCSGRTTKRASRNGLYGASSLKDLSCLQKSFEEVNGGEGHLVQVRDVESCSFGHPTDTCGMATTGRLWRTESWDSLGSGGSHATTLSLADRVEKNRSMLQEMLNMSQLNNCSSHELHTLHRHKKEASALGNDGPSNEILPNDVDWDSGVSLQDSENYRAFVPSQELELSPRHEQAKQLLQRARMKARTNPLRASHNILPTFSQQRRDPCEISATKENFVLKDGDSHASGNLSDSSSGESSCGQQRKRGPSPSRVRFEDESARDAEVRYLERLQQRQKRVLDSVLLSLGHGPLVSKPDLSNYINGDLQRKENGICKPGWKQQSTQQAAVTHQSSRGRAEKGTSLVVNKEGKCSACGSYVSKLASRNPDISVNQTGSDMHKTCNVIPQSKHEHKELSTSQEDTCIRPLGPKGTPLWILPSRQRVYTERIRETYIGEVTCIDDVDSALDSTTDTSDSYRTDSEEAGTISQQTVFKTHWHSGPGPDSRLLCPSQKEAKSMKNEEERHWSNASNNPYRDELQDNVPSIKKGDPELGANETNQCKVKGASEIKSQANKIISSKAISRGNHPVDVYPVAKKGKDQGAKTQFREPIPTVHSQQLPSYKAPDSLINSLNKKSMESFSHKPSNNLSQGTDPSRQLNKEMAAGFNLENQVPALGATGKTHSSPLPYRRTVLTGSYNLASPDTGQVEEANELPVYSTSPNIHNTCISQIAEQNGMQSPKMFSKRQLLALSTNNCNNTYAKRQSKTSVTATVKSKEEQLQNSQKIGKKHGSPSPPVCGAPPVNSRATNCIAISHSLTTEETNSSISGHSVIKEAPATGAQKTKSVQASTVQRKPIEIFPETKKKQFAKKGGTSSSSSSASGLKKFFSSLSQNTKQKLGRFRCYSMEQISAPEPGALPTEEPGLDTTRSPKMKKAPSLQSLQLVSSFCQPRKASSVQNLHSLWGKTDRSSLYLLGDPKEEDALPNRKAGSQHRRSLSVEDIGSPNLMRTVGRVVEVFPDGTSQLELQRSPQGNFGFRVSSGNGRPDTGIYVQEMADPNTAKLYAGLLGAGDEILEVNGAKVAGLGLAQINELLLWSDTLAVRVLRQRPLRR